MLYLSDSKLRQFLPERRRGRVSRRLTALRLTTPVGGLELESTGNADAEQQKQEHLISVIRYIEERALWFEDPATRAGQWVYFEAPCAMFVPRPDTVLFIDPVPGAVAGYEQGARLLLHGSSSHLLTGELPPVRPLSGDTPFKGSRLTLIDLALNDLSRVSPPTADELHEPRPGLPLNFIGHLMDVAQHRLSSWTAAWMRGYARITAVLPVSADQDHAAGSARYVCATPLYVEYAHDLPQG
ncbi:SAVMC3_10250 family protein [Streptomyces sp. NPDC001812]|uniref:SAVMC3_10250 family protein n=1 Tax=Streptomyces sp. NPDC001812 TaxID=3364611 RepID=UPI00367D92F0